MDTVRVLGGMRERDGGKRNVVVNEISMYHTYPTEKRHYVNPALRGAGDFFVLTCDLCANLSRPPFPLTTLRRPLAKSEKT